MYNDKTYYENEFRRIQESRRNPASGTEPERFWRMDKILSDSDKQYLGRIFSGFLGQRDNDSERSQCSCRWNDRRTDLKAKENTFSIIEVQASIFHDIFEINRSYLRYGELVDLHDDYNGCKCFLTSDGLAGFAIEPDGNLVSVFSQYGRLKQGFLHAIKDFIIEQGATHCDCYDSKLQPLPAIYEKTIGWQSASRMKYNMAYDHDDIAKNHDMPDIAFLVWSPHKVERHDFNEDEYLEASLWQKETILKSNISCNLNNNQSVFPGTRDKLWKYPPYLVTDIKFNADYNQISSLTIKNGIGKIKTFSGNQIDGNNRIILELNDLTIKYGIMTGKTEFFPHPKKSESTTKLSKPRGMHR